MIAAARPALDKQDAVMVLVLAHRGANRLARENTLAAFRAAYDLGADGVEFDVRLTADGALAVHHDAAIDGYGSVRDLRAADLPDWVPSLAEALDVCASMALVNVEIKLEAGGDIEALAEAVAGTLDVRAAPPGLLVSSFSLDVIDAHRRIAPSIPTGWLTTLPPTPEMLDVVAGRGHAGVHPYELLIDGPAVDRAHERSLLVAAWTVDDPIRAARLAQLGVDVLITDDPTAIQNALNG